MRNLGYLVLTGSIRDLQPILANRDGHVTIKAAGSTEYTHKMRPKYEQLVFNKAKNNAKV